MLYDNYTDYMIATSYVTMLYDNYTDYDYMIAYLIPYDVIR